MHGHYYVPHGHYGGPHDYYSRYPHMMSGPAHHMHHPASHPSQIPYYPDHQGYSVPYHPGSYSVPYYPPGSATGMSCRNSTQYGAEHGRMGAGLRSAMAGEDGYAPHMQHAYPVPSFDPSSPYQ